MPRPPFQYAQNPRPHVQYACLKLLSYRVKTNARFMNLVQLARHVLHSGSYVLMAIIKITGGEAIVDADLVPMLSNFNWHKVSHGYAQCNVGAKKVLMHRMIMGAKGVDIVDHLNGNRLDNRRENLRFATRSQNGQNVKKKNKTGFIGVVYDSGGYIKATIKIHGKKRHLGMFDTLIEAARAYDEAALRLFGPDALTNLKHYQNIVLELSGGKKERNKT